QRFSYNTSKPLTQDSSESSIMQLDPSSVYSSDEPMEYYKESNEHSFEENNISYHDEPAIYSSEELDEDINSCKEFTSETSSNSINSCDELSSDSLSTSVENEFFEDIANKALDLNKLSQNIATNAYDELVEILHYLQFNINHVIKNIQFFRRWRQRLPLMPIYSRSINISTIKTSSKSNKIKKYYYLLIKDIIWNVLNNPSLMQHMHFGPGQEVTHKLEYCMITYSSNLFYMVKNQ
ncbi:16389_t:CDS:2, partial [Cetraspora pellucida]